MFWDFIFLELEFPGRHNLSGADAPQKDELSLSASTGNMISYLSFYLCIQDNFLILPTASYLPQHSVFSNPFAW